jgi:hypothetical protein
VRVRGKAFLNWEDVASLKVDLTRGRLSVKVHRTRSIRQPVVTVDGKGLVSHAGAGLLSEMADRSGLTGALSEAMGKCGISWHTHDPGVVLGHLAVAIADGAECLSDLAVLREQTELFGPVASQATAWRAIEAVTAPDLRGIAAAVAAARPGCGRSPRLTSTD